MPEQTHLFEETDSHQLKLEGFFGPAELEPQLRDHFEDPEESAALTSRILQPDQPARRSKLQELMELSRTHFAHKDYEASLQVVNELLKLDSTNMEARSLLNEVQNRWEEHCFKEELKDHIEKIKKEAIDQFEKGHYSQCLAKFMFLCEVEPENRTLGEFLEITQEQIREMEERKLKAAITENTGGEGAQQFEWAKAVPGGATTVRYTSQLENREPAMHDDVHPVAGSVGLSPEDSATLPNRAEEIDPSQSLGDRVPLRQPHASLERELHGTTAEELENSEENPGIERDSKRMRVLVLSLVALALLTGALIGRWLALDSSPTLSTLEIQSDPVGAIVFLDGVPKGQTPFRLESVTAGKYKLRIEKEAYAPMEQDLQIEKGQPARLSLQLERLSLPALPTDLKVWPNHGDARHQMKTIRTKVKTPGVESNPSNAKLPDQIQDLQSQIELSLHSANYFPPQLGNAIDLIKRLNSLSPGARFGEEKLEQIRGELIAQANRKMQTKNFEQVKAILRQLQEYFPESPEVKNLSGTFEVQEAQNQQAKATWIVKAESAMALGHFLTPSQDNAVFYSNRALSVDPQDQKALVLKKESLSKASTQAEELVQKGKFDEARDLYSSLLYLSQSESRPPFDSRELKEQIAKLEFTGYPVIHDHAVGSCTGRLRMNGYVITYVPMVDSKDGFLHKLTEIAQVEAGDRLKIQFQNKSYRFQTNLAKSREDNRQKIAAIYLQITHLKEKAQ